MPKVLRKTTDRSQGRLKPSLIPEHERDIRDLQAKGFDKVRGQDREGDGVFRLPRTLKCLEGPDGSPGGPIIPE